MRPGGKTSVKGAVVAEPLPPVRDFSQSFVSLCSKTKLDHHLPRLQRRLVKAAVQNPFHESVEAIADLTGVSVPKRSLEEILRDAALDFDAFYRERAPEPTNGSILVAAVDGKGIPMVKPGGAQPAGRLTKGQKANRKRMATVAQVLKRFRDF